MRGRQSSRCLAAYVYAAAGQGESTTDLAWDGQTMIYESGDLLGRDRALPRRAAAHRSPTSTSTGCRQERLRHGHLRRQPPHARRRGSTAFRTVDVRARRRPPATSACAARSTASRSCPTTPSGSRWTATRPTTSRSPGSSSGCARSASPKVVIGVSGGLDSTHALIVAAKAMDRLGLPRSDILAFTLPGFATSETHQGATRTRLMRGARRHASRSSTSARRPQQMLADLGHPFADGEPVYDVTFENVQAGLRTDYLFRLANQHGGIVLGTGDLSELALGWCTYGVGDQMSHYNVNAGVPKTLIQHLIRWVDRRPAQFDDEADDVLRDDPRAPRSRPSWSRPSEGEQPQSDRGHGRPLRAAGLHPLLRAALRLPAVQDRLPGLARLARRRRGRVAAGLPGRRARRRTTWPTIRHWLEVFLQRFFGSASSSARRCRTARRSAPAARCRRAATGGRRPTRSAAAWLAELRAQRPGGLTRSPGLYTAETCAGHTGPRPRRGGER